MYTVIKTCHYKIKQYTQEFKATIQLGIYSLIFIQKCGLKDTKYKFVHHSIWVQYFVF